MLNDSNLAKHVNIIKSNRDDLPNDVYTMMVDAINYEINEVINTKPEFSNIGNLKINRKFIKRGIMTIPYGATIKGIMNQLITDFFILQDPVKGEPRLFLLNNNLFNKINRNIYLKYKELYILSSIIHNILYKTFPKLEEFVLYLKNMNKLLKKLNLKTI
jgi:DNA-directed RNA polymerase